MTAVAGPHTAPWKELADRAQRARGLSVSTLFDRDPERFEAFSREAMGLLFDFSRQRLDRDTLATLLELPDAVSLKTGIAAMWNGDHINRAEDRAVLHVALRQDRGDGVGGLEIEAAVLAERERMLRFADAVRSGGIRVSGGRRVETVINIGIGGSDLGPVMAVQALRQFRGGGPRVEFASNVDGCKLSDLMEEVDPASTLIIVASKTFTTQETLANAHAARAWIAAKLGEAAVPSHFAAVSVNAEAMNAFGIHPDYRFMMWDWVGGRYSLWSCIGVSIAVAIGGENFLALLAGAREMDRHFHDAPWERNLPVLMALLGIWNINFLELPTLAVLPYDERLARFPAFLQQLEMESNGKSVTTGGQPVAWATAPVVWGEPGNNAQHSFFQLLHQGTARAAMDFLLPARSSCGREDQQQLAIANCLAQAEAFMTGQQGVPLQKVHEGNRPSTLMQFEKLDPRTLGRLVALYEHKVYVQSLVWGINAFDQWGVELGKRLCASLVPAVKLGAGESELPSRLRQVLSRIRSE